MGLIRLIIFALVIWMIWRWVKNFQANQQAKTGAGNKAKNKIENGNMVPCQYCSVHVPQHDAVSSQAPDEQGELGEPLWFCSEAHRKKYLANNQ